MPQLGKLFPEEGETMEVKSFAATLGIGMVAGATVMLMIPRRSPVYKAANRAVSSVKRSVSHAVDTMMA